jgi:hypothetical protein
VRSASLGNITGDGNDTYRGKLAWPYNLTKPLRFISIREQRILPGMPKKSAVIPTKKPVPLVKPIPPVPLAVIPPLEPGRVAKNLTGKLTRPNPVVRRGRK